MPSSRSSTRAFLLQVLYSDIFVSESENNLTIFRETYRDESFYQNIDESYFSRMRENIHANIAPLMTIISEFAGKFDIETMPKIHVIILMIALSEMLYWNKNVPEDFIDEKISINEAIELAKRFSDDAGAKFINGALGNFIKNREAFQKNPVKNYQFFS